MKITAIFAEKLFSFHYDGEEKNILSQLLENWNDMEYLLDFFSQYEAEIITNHYLNVNDVFEFIEIVKKNTAIIENKINDNLDNLNLVFEALSVNQSLYEILPRQKGKQQFLRIYALKIAENCFVITGGAIKLTQKMQDNNITAIELKSLNECREYLRQNDIMDDDSFFEFLNENQND